MCTVSMVGDHYNDWFKQPQYQQTITNFPEISRLEFDKLKNDVEQMRQLLIRAKLYDEKNNEPNCEIEEKMATLRKIAELVGINLDEVIKPTPPKNG